MAGIRNGIGAGWAVLLFGGGGPVGQGGMRLAQAVFTVSHEALDIGYLDWDERREIFVAGIGDQDHVLEAESEVQILNAHFRFDGEDLPWLQGCGGNADVVNFQTDSVAEDGTGSLALRTVGVYERDGRGLDLVIGEM